VFPGAIRSPFQAEVNEYSAACWGLSIHWYDSKSHALGWFQQLAGAGAAIGNKRVANYEGRLVRT
jgi:hypothetical protein